MILTHLLLQSLTIHISIAAPAAAQWQLLTRGRPASQPAVPTAFTLYLGIQLDEEPSISQVAKRFIGTGLLRPDEPVKLSLPFSAMLSE